MPRSDRLPLLAIVLATILGLALSTTGGSGGTAAAGATDVVAGSDETTATDTGDANGSGGGIRSLSLIDPAAVTDLAAEVVATTTTTTTSTTTTTMAPPATTTPPPSTGGGSGSSGSGSSGATRSAPPATSPPPPPPPPPAEPTASASCAANFHAWMNSLRSQNGVAALANDTGISSIPLNWSMSMARNQSLGHNPNYTGQVRSARPQARSVGENVGYSSGGDRAVFDQMAASGSHRSAMLSSGYTHAATGCAVDPQGKVWVTVDFWG